MSYVYTKCTTALPSVLFAISASKVKRLNITIFDCSCNSSWLFFHDKAIYFCIDEYGTKTYAIGSLRG